MNAYNTLATCAYEPEPSPTAEQLASYREAKRLRDLDRRARGWSDEDFKKGWSEVDSPASPTPAR